MRRLKSITIGAAVVTTCWLAVAFHEIAYAENWPGWRKDGTGVSADSNVPIEWSNDENLRWRTPISGQGHSSPIVWDDQVFVTAVRPTVDRHPLATATLVALSVLCGLALWRLTDGTFRDPLGNDPTVWEFESTRAGLIRKASVWLLFVVLGYGTIVAIEMAYDVLEKYPETLRNRVIDKTWYFTDAPGYQELETPISPFRALTGRKVEGPFFGSPRIPLSCYYGGVIALLALLAVNTTIANRHRDLVEATPSAQDINTNKHLLRIRFRLLGLDVRFGIRAERSLREILRALVDGIACFAAACFLVTVHSAAMAELPYVPSGTTWFLTVAIVVVSLIAFNLLLPWRPLVRVMGLAVTAAWMFYLVAEAPPNEEFGIFATALRAGLRPLVKLMLVLVALGLVAACIAPANPTAQYRGLARRWSLTIAAFMILISGGLYFALSNFLLPRSVYAYELISIDRKTGDVQWTTRCDSSESIPKLHVANTMATPTPVTDGDHVYAHFSNAGLFCVDLNGDLKWQYSDPNPASHWGAASSPILWRDLLIMTYDTDHRSMTVAIDKHRGDERWRSDRTSRIEPSQLYDGYSTPIAVDRNGEPELVHLACHLLGGYDPLTGEERWSLSHPGEQPVCTPVVWEDLVMILGGKYTPYLAAVRVSTHNDQQVAEVAWEGTRNLSDMPSPVVYDGLFYMVTKDGIATCLDVKTGESKWRRRMPGAFWSSLSAAGGAIYFCNANGMTTVVAAGPEYVELSKNEIGESVYASFAISDGEIFIRTEEHLLCIAADGDTSPSITPSVNTND